MEKDITKNKIWNKTWFTILMLIVFFPLGIFTMFRYKKFNKVVRIIIIGFFAIILCNINFWEGIKDGASAAINDNNVIVNDIDSTEDTTISTDTTTASTEATTEKDISKILNVELNETMESNNGKVRFTIQTTLPDTTELMLTLKELNNKYIGQTKVTIMNGTATTEWFSNSDSALRNGEYSLSISMSLPIFQSEEVQKVVGSNGELMQGEYVKKATIEDSYIVSKETSVTINNGASLQEKISIDEEHKQVIADFYNELINEYKKQSVSYDELSFGKFIADWNKRRNEAQTKMDEEDPLLEHLIAMGDLNTLESNIRNKLAGRNYDQQYINNTMDYIESVINN